jgi:hypothetical protein
MYNNLGNYKYIKSEIYKNTWNTIK